MKLSELVKKDIDRVVEEWEAFARTEIAAGKNLSAESLRDHAKALLLAVIEDLETSQTSQAQNDKSRGGAPGNSEELTAAAQVHAKHRFEQNFTLNQMVSEYRALRASVIRRWEQQKGPLKHAMLEELVRFGETIDQAMTESISWYSQKVEDTRNLLLGVLGHDLRQPLSTVRMSAQLFLRAEGLDGRLTKIATRIFNSTDVMRTMVGDLLDFTQTALGVALPISPVAGDFSEMCEDVVTEVAALHPERALTFEGAPDLTGFWDAGRVRQMASNLLANSVQHSAAPTPVTVVVTGDSDAVSLRVHNEGLSIPETIRSTLFEPMMRATDHPHDRYTGSSGLGLGLYIARAIVVAHDGSIEVESSDEGGTSFTVRLPRRATRRKEDASMNSDGVATLTRRGA